MTKPTPHRNKLDKSPRRLARESAVQALYQAAINSDSSLPTIMANTREAHLTDDENISDSRNRIDEALFAELVNGAYRNRSEYMQLIRPHLDRDEKDINPIERATLLVACHELSRMPETPYPVIINEAIEVTKTFGGTDSHKFINGILDKLAAELRPNDPKRPSR